MRTLKKPTDSVKTVFLQCIGNYQSEDLKNRLGACIGDIELATKEFEDKASIACTHTISIHKSVSGVVTSKEMCNVYEDKLAKKHAPGRMYYDKYLSAPQNGVCPLCGLRQATTLDHYLPKMKFPSLAVTPSNLVPACRDCNTSKHDDSFSRSNEEIIHPYFDNIENDLWLYACIAEEDMEPVVTYHASKPAPWDDILFDRVKNHFEVFELNRLYATHAAEEITSIKHKLRKLYQTAGAASVRLQLKEDMESSEYAHLNSWKSALYRALHDSQWICEEWLKHGK